MAKLSYFESNFKNYEGIYDLNTTLISSDGQEDESYKIVLEIIKKIFKGKSFVFKAIGLPGNIIDVMNEIKMYNMHYLIC